MTGRWTNFDEGNVVNPVFQFFIRVQINIPRESFCSEPRASKAVLAWA